MKTSIPFAWLLVVAGPAAAASVEALLPTPGFYQVETTARNTHHAMQSSVDFEPHQDQHCIRRGNVKAGTMVVVTQLLAQCPRQSTRVEGATVVMTAQCPPTTLRSVIRKAGSNVWEIETRTEVAANQDKVDLGRMRAGVEAMAAHGNAQERAQARQQLAQLPAMQTDLNQQRAAMAEQLRAARPKARTQLERDLIDKHLASLTEQGGPPGLTSVVKKRMTRIADSCPAVPAAAAAR